MPTHTTRISNLLIIAFSKINLSQKYIFFCLLFFSKVGKIEWLPFTAVHKTFMFFGHDDMLAKLVSKLLRKRKSIMPKFDFPDVYSITWLESGFRHWGAKLNRRNIDYIFLFFFWGGGCFITQMIWQGHINPLLLFLLKLTPYNREANIIKKRTPNPEIPTI